MTDAKLVPLDALANRAILEEASQDGEPITPSQAMAEISKVLGRPGKVARALAPDPKPHKPSKKGAEDARSPEVMGRAAMGLITADSDLPVEEAVQQAMERAGLNRAMMAQVLESPNWAGEIARLCQQYLYVTHLPRIVSAQISKAMLGDTKASEHLADLFGKSDLDKLDEQTKALAEASPETRIRHTEALMEDLQRMLSEAKGVGADAAQVEAARSRAIAAANVRKATPR